MSAKKTIVVHTAKRAIERHNMIKSKFPELQARLIKPLPLPEEQGEKPMTLNDHLAANGMPALMSHKMALAKKHGIPGYWGHPEQDKQLLAGMQAMQQNDEQKKQAEAQGQQAEGEKRNSDREFGLKEKEHGLKEREMTMKEQESKHKQKQEEANKAPSAEEIANEIIKKIKD